MASKLYLIPTPLGENSLATVLPYTVEVIGQLGYFIAERAKTARHFLKTVPSVSSIQELNIAELDKHNPHTGIEEMLQPALEGNNMGLLSEAGCPAVADPGALVVALAHRKGIEVVPLVGASSILLALMASGLNGQQFCFHGYLSPKRNILAKDLQRLESLARKNKATQIFIETPYRNMAVIETALKCLSPGTQFCIAANLTLNNQFIHTCSIGEWRKKSVPDLHKEVVVFLVG